MDSAGIPQSTTPGIGGGLRSSRIRASSSSSEEFKDKSSKDALDVVDGASGLGSSTISSDKCARGWLFVGGGLRMIIWDFGSGRATEL